jgi:hypothetical protein
MPLTPHKSWLSTATLGCFPARPLLVRLRTEHSLPTARFSLLRLNWSPSSASSRTPSREPSRPCHLTSPASLLPRAIQTP